MMSLKETFRFGCFLLSLSYLLLYCASSMAALPINELSHCTSWNHGETKAPCIEDNDSIFQSETTQSSNYPGDIDTQEKIIKYFSNEPWSKQNKLPTIGLALSGGGSKSAPFVMGIMKRFAENDWLADTDIISSVSGGGYAAYYFYKKMWMIKKHSEYMKEYKNFEDSRKGVLSIPSHKEIFADIRREQYGEDPYKDGCEFYDETHLTRCNVVTADYHSYGKLPRGSYDCSKFGINSTRHQGYVECFQDILSVSPGGKSKTDSRFPYAAFATLLGSTAISLPFHHIANSLFDWKLPLSPSQEIYLTGIKRTYGNTPDNRADYFSFDIFPTEDTFDFDGLMSLYEDCDDCGKLPWWIINMTNKVQDENARFLNKTVFELTGNSLGSGNYGYLFGYNPSKTLKSFKPIDAVAASGAFFDSLTAYKTYNFSNQAIFYLLHGLNLRWGIEIPNFRVSNNVRTLHSLIPWPFYYLHKFTRDQKSAYIRLADGGQSGENLGIYSLLRRGTKNIIIADGAYDLNGDQLSELPELCVTNQLLNRNGLEIVFSGLPNTLPDKDIGVKTHLSEICGDSGDSGPRIQSKFLDSFSPYKWKRSVWAGQITRLHDQTLEKGFEILEGIKIFYLKSAVDYYDSVQTELKDIQINQTTCDGENKDNGVIAKNDMPCTLIGYLIDSGYYRLESDPLDNKFKKVKVVLPEKKSIWPQTKTVLDTANGSANTFAAYRDLGWYAARKLTCLMNDDGVNQDYQYLDVCMNAKNTESTYKKLYKH